MKRLQHFILPEFQKSHGFHRSTSLAPNAIRHERRLPRAAGELGAAIEAMEKSTQTILKSAETIDGCAQTLTAMGPSDEERVAAREIQAQLIHIFEACNFHDLAGQRIGKVIETLCRIDGELARMLDEHADAPQATRASAAPVKDRDELLNGPQLDGDSGHASQRDIDALFS